MISLISMIYDLDLYIYEIYFVDFALLDPTGTYLWSLCRTFR